MNSSVKIHHALVVNIGVSLNDQYVKYQILNLDFITELWE